MKKRKKMSLKTDRRPYVEYGDKLTDDKQLSDDEKSDKDNSKQITGSKKSSTRLIGAAKNRLSAFAEHDLVIRIENTSLHVNKDQLMAESPVFKEKIAPVLNGTSEKEVQIDGKNLNTFVDFLRCTLPGIDEKMTDSIVHDVLPLAYEYKTTKTIEKADTFLADKCRQMSNKITSAQIVKNILQAEIYGLTTYLEECITIASRKCFDQLIKHRQFNEITRETRLKIAMKRWSHMDAAMKATGRVNPPTESADFYMPLTSTLGFSFGQQVSSPGFTFGGKQAKTLSSPTENLVDAIQSFMHNN